MIFYTRFGGRSGGSGGRESGRCWDRFLPLAGAAVTNRRSYFAHLNSFFPNEIDALGHLVGRIAGFPTLKLLVYLGLKKHTLEA